MAASSRTGMASDLGLLVARILLGAIETSAMRVTGRSRLSAATARSTYDALVAMTPVEREELVVLDGPDAEGRDVDEDGSPPDHLGIGQEGLDLSSL